MGDIATTEMSSDNLLGRQLALFVIPDTLASSAGHIGIGK
jgi:hypothetical protein